MGPGKGGKKTDRVGGENRNFQRKIIDARNGKETLGVGKGAVERVLFVREEVEKGTVGHKHKPGQKSPKKTKKRHYE